MNRDGDGCVGLELLVREIGDKLLILAILAEDVAGGGRGGGVHELFAEGAGAGEIVDVDFEEAFERLEGARGDLGGVGVEEVEVKMEEGEEGVLMIV